ncbi:tripartite tricarboxylate transporter permease [Larsenimonas rhizosphaerae]|uniref:tripartite tricarboxylate transporter permease n=1 Tax=Larsenimonas rhizosphaerae TaxID=2944682 RepID=UPI0020337B2A|nr:tripartite tricarboxylate transporter permease [Larsenimonas rhizosphaerae]MCM2130223.1 tripartite tricarboxylate transporter permease [Larsenimonas rhizosphaerae]
MLLDAFHALLDVWVLIAALVGVAVGIVIGAIPGLGPTLAIALLIPVTFTMSPIPSLILLLGVYQGAIFGGSISAILLNVPGTPSSAATALDGHPMARQGRAGEALRIALYASVFGNIFSCLVLIVLAQPLASLALDFGPAQMAALMTFALIIIVLFGGGSILDAALMALIGVAAGIIGLDPIEGLPRFTFGSFAAEDGLALIPVLIGLFAMSEVLLQAFAGKQKTAPDTDIGPVSGSGTSNRPVGWLTLWKMRATLMVSSIIGTLVGILPGIGSTVPAFVSYNLARSRSRDPARFGKGEPEGVAAPEAANNAVTGGALVPMLSLGIPGDAVTAVILGAFMLQGLTPGPFLFQQHGVEVYAIFEALILLSIPCVVFGLAMFRGAVHIIKIRPRHLFPVIAILAIFGAYSVNNSLFDVAVMLGAGGIGFVLRRAGFPLPPLLIGLILGPPLEQSLRQALLTSAGSADIFLQSPIAMGLLAVTLLCVLGVIIRRYRHTHQGDAS